MKFDLSIIYIRPDGSYVINQGMYHVPNNGAWVDLWAEVDAYAKEHPEVVQAEPSAPEPTFDKVKASALSRIDSATSSSILAGFDYVVNEETLHFSYDAFDQANFNQTANIATLALSGVDGLPDSVTWNGYRNYTPETGGELVRVTLTSSDFIELYVKGASAHKATQMEIGGQRKAAIEACTTVEEINALLEEWSV